MLWTWLRRLQQHKRRKGRSSSTDNEQLQQQLAAIQDEAGISSADGHARKLSMLQRYIIALHEPAGCRGLITMVSQAKNPGLTQLPAAA